MKKHRIIVVFLAIGILVLIGLWTWMHLQSRTTLPSFSVETIIKISLGDKRLEIARLPTLQQAMQPGLSKLEGFMPADVDAQGNIYILSNSSQKLFVFDAHGKPIRKIKCSWLNWRTPFLMRVEAGNAESIWFADDVLNGLWPRLVKATSDGKPLWEIGRPYQKTKQQRTTALLRPLNYKSRGDDFDQIAKLFAQTNGDIFVLTYDGRMCKFSAEGEFLSHYIALSSFTSRDKQLPKFARIAPVFSAIATPDSYVYSIPCALASDNYWLTYLWLDSWITPSQRSGQLINLAELEPMREMMLVGSDAKKNLYFKYLYSPSRKRKRDDIPILWQGPMAIAKIDSNSKVYKVFDIYEYYKGEIDKAKQQADEKRKKRGPIGIGDLIHVSADGALYLEVADATHYRIDKISFSQQ